MLVNKANIAAVFENINSAFQVSFDGAPIEWEKTTMLVPSGALTEKYNWISDFPQMKPWIGDKVLKALSASDYSITNEEYEATIRVRRVDIETDQLGKYAIQARNIGTTAKQWPEELDADLKNNAFATVCYDGQYFYDTDHPVAGSTYSNLITPALSAATTAAAAASLGAAITTLEAVTDDEGRKLGVVADMLEVPSALRATGSLLCNSPILTDLSPNPYYGQLKLKVNPRLTSAVKWAVHCTSRAIKPFVFQQRKAPIPVQQIDTTSTEVFMRGNLLFGVESSGNAGYGLWQLSCGSNGTT